MPNIWQITYLKIFLKNPTIDDYISLIKEPKIKFFDTKLLVPNPYMLHNKPSTFQPQHSKY